MSSTHELSKAVNGVRRLNDNLDSKSFYGDLTICFETAQKQVLSNNRIYERIE